MFILSALFSLLVTVTACRRRELEPPGRRFQREGQKEWALVWFPLNNPDAVSNCVIAKNVEYFMRIQSLLESDE